MSHKASILVVGDNPDNPGQLAGELETRGFEVIGTGDPDKAVKAAARNKSDIVIIFAAAVGPKIEAAISLTRELTGGNGASKSMVILIGPVLDAEQEAAGFSAGANVYMSIPYSDAQLFNRLQSLVRLVTMRDELELRAETTRKYGINEAFEELDEEDQTESRVLAVIRGTADLAVMEEVLASQFHLTFAKSAESALDYLTRRPFDAIVVNAGGDAEPWQLCRDIKGNSRLFSIPILVVADRDGLDDPEAPFEAGASDVIYRPVQGIELTSRLRAFVGEGRYRTAMHKIYREARHYLTSDALTGLYSYGFAMEHLAAAVIQAESSGRNFSVGVFNVKKMAAVNAEHGYASGDRLLRQIGNLIGYVIRGEDMAARIGGQEFCVVLPDTDLENARIVLERIAGVINSTAYLVPETSESMSIRLRSGSAGFEPGDSTDSLIERARQSMK